MEWSLVLPLLLHDQFLFVLLLLLLSLVAELVVDEGLEALHKLEAVLLSLQEIVLTDEESDGAGLLQRRRGITGHLPGDLGFLLLAAGHRFDEDVFDTDEEYEQVSQVRDRSARLVRARLTPRVLV